LAVLPLLLLLGYAVVNPYQLTAQTTTKATAEQEIVITGKVVDGDTEDIESVNVFKKKEDIEKFGYGTDYEGVISIKMKKVKGN